MIRPDDLTADLPPLHEEEPEDLRRSIADELTDHLVSAFEHERSNFGSDDDAQKAVLKNFGDPATIARRLWFDAMKERIMKNRMMLAMAILTLLVTIGIGGYVFTAMRNQSAVNEQVIGTLKGMESELAALAPTHGEIKIELVDDTPEENPVADHPVRIAGATIDGKQFGFNLKTDAEGRITTGKIPVGNYTVIMFDDPKRSPQGTSLTIAPSSSGGDAYTFRDELALFSGKTYENRIAMPQFHEVSTSLVLDFNLPSQLPDSAFAATIVVAPAPIELSPGDQWLPRRSNYPTLYFGFGGEFPDPRSVHLPRSNFSSKFRIVYPENRNLAGGSGSTASINLMPWSVSVKKLIVGSIVIYRQLNDEMMAQMLEVNKGLPTQSIETFKRQIESSDKAFVRIDNLPQDAWRDFEFQPQPGVENVWTIELPEDVINELLKMEAEKSWFGDSGEK